MITGDWIAGFADGEAWFTIMLPPNKSNRLVFGAIPMFRIELQRADIKMLYLIQEFLGVGRVWVSHGPGRQAGRGTYICSSLKDCIKIRDVFRKHPLQSKKANTFKLWSQAIDIIFNKEHLNIEGLLKLARIRDRMNIDTRKQSRLNYHNYKYFESILIKNYQQSDFFN